MDIDLSDAKGVTTQTLHAEFFVGRQMAVALRTNGLPLWVITLNRQLISVPDGVTATLRQLVERADEQRTQTRKDLDAFADQSLARRLRFELDPKFDTSREGDTLRMVGDDMKFEVRLMPLDPMYDSIYLVDRLDVLRKTDLQSPPFSNLALIDELERRQCFARDLVVSYRDPAMGKVHVRYLFGALSDEENRKVGPLLSAP